MSVLLRNGTHPPIEKLPGRSPLRDVGWHWGFGLAALGMTLAVIQFALGQKYLGTAGLRTINIQGKRTAQRQLLLGVLLSAAIACAALGISRWIVRLYAIPQWKERRHATLLPGSRCHWRALQGKCFHFRCRSGVPRRSRRGLLDGRGRFGLGTRRHQRPGGTRCCDRHGAQLGDDLRSVGGLVQIPCIERNAFGSVEAVNAARMAMKETTGHKVSLDQVIRTMYQTRLDMQTCYKETALGGLALNVIEC
jgi:Serine dehydratase alpha chain/POT family